MQKLRKDKKMISSGKENPYVAHWQQLGVQVDTWKGHVGTPMSLSSAENVWNCCRHRILG